MCIHTQDLLLRLQPEQAYYQNQLHNLMMEEQTMLHEMEYLKRKALLREGKVVFLFGIYVCMFLHKAVSLGQLAKH